MFKHFFLHHIFFYPFCRETPTSVGPNSFGKTKQGFCDFKKMFEKTMKKAMDTCTDPNNKVEES